MSGGTAVVITSQAPALWLDLLHWVESMGGRDKVQQSTQCGDGFLPSLLSSLHYQAHGSLAPTRQMPLACLDRRALLNLQIFSLCLPHTCLGYLLIVRNTRTVPRPGLKQNHILMSWVEVGASPQLQHLSVNPWQWTWLHIHYWVYKHWMLTKTFVLPMVEQGSCLWRRKRREQA